MTDDQRKQKPNECVYVCVCVGGIDFSDDYNKTKLGGKPLDLD